MRLTSLLCVSIAMSASMAAAQPNVTAVTPLPQAIQAYHTTDITIDFDALIDPYSITGNTVRVFGRWSGPMAGTLTLENHFRRLRFDPAEEFFAGEWVTVTVAKTLASQSGIPMGRGYSWNFWVRTNPGTLDLTLQGTVPIRQSGETWIQSYGAYAGDLDNDGWSDMTIPSERSNDVRVFMNDGAGGYGTFAVTAVPNGERPSTNEGADFDNDGEIDIAIGSANGDYVGVLLGNGTGGWKSATAYLAGAGVRGLGVLDLNGDGWDDVVTSNRFADNISLFVNDGDGTFGEARFMEGGGDNEFGLAVADANNDGLMDVFVGAYGAPQKIILLLGDGIDSLIVSDAITVAGNPWMLAVGDVDNDGNVDVVSANSSGNVAVVAFGDGAGNFSSVDTYTTGGFPLAIDLGDLDGDGDLDMVTSNYDGEDWSIYENLGGGLFGNLRTLSASSAGSCATLHDRDNDHDLDITGIDELDDLLFIFENDPPPTHTEDALAAGVALLQNHPNPFNPATTIRFALDRPLDVVLSVYDVQGRLVAKLAEGAFDAGAHQVPWNGADSAGDAVSSGVYFYRLEAGGETLVRKMVLLQ